MVKLREDNPLHEDGTINLSEWLKRVSGFRCPEDIALIEKACQLAKLAKDEILPNGSHCLEHGLHVAEILHQLNLDTLTVVTGIIFSAYLSKKVPLALIQEQLGPDCVYLIQELGRMGEVQARSALANDPQKLEQNLQNLRKMMLAIAEDMRVVIILLTDHLAALRDMVKGEGEYRRQLAIQTREIFAPLANRLGMGQLKWELEDFAFRILEPTVYKNIAKLLDEKRTVRETYIDTVIHQLQTALDSQGIKAELSGRAKHIYSIWRKMQRKGVSYSEIYDVRAIRVIVSQLSDCYAALGVVHTLWQHIPKEFDDYIANPKNNGYQSLHTALIGPEGRVLEIQIRTKDMHQQSELGVAAHWRYKEGGKQEPGFDEKLSGLRQMLDWQKEIVDDDESADALQNELFNDRVYVFSPNGDVFDLPQGATAIDFAYTVHTEVGHRCRGAKINGQMISLTQPLQHGQQVEILTAREGGPSRDWLNPHLKYVMTSRARSKIHQWFKHQDREQNIHDGRDILNREFKRLGVSKINLSDIADNIANCHSDEDLLAGVGNGDIRLSQVLGAIQRIKPKAGLEEQQGLVEKIIRKSSQKKTAEITVDGIGHMMCHMARCCRPVPGDPIIGYITIGEGVSVHRQDCINILQHQQQKRERLIEVEWGHETKSLYLVNVAIKAYKRRSLLKDITSVLAAERVDLQNISSKNDKKDVMVIYELSLEVSGIEMLGRVVSRLQQIPNVVDVYRIHE